MREKGKRRKGEEGKRLKGAFAMIDNYCSLLTAYGSLYK
jgi:hypothetical protein